MRRVPPAFGVAVRLIVDGWKPSQSPKVDTIIHVEADSQVVRVDRFVLSKGSSPKLFTLRLVVAAFAGRVEYPHPITNVVPNVRPSPEVVPCDTVPFPSCFSTTALFSCKHTKCEAL